MDDRKAKEALGLTDDKWIIQFTDEEVRFLQNLVANEKARHEEMMTRILTNLNQLG